MYDHNIIMSISKAYIEQKKWLIQCYLSVNSLCSKIWLQQMDFDVDTCMTGLHKCIITPTINPFCYNIICNILTYVLWTLKLINKIWWKCKYVSIIQLKNGIFKRCLAGSNKFLDVMFLGVKTCNLFNFYILL